MIKEIREELDQLGEESYKQFNQKLIPGTDHVIGVRMPALRKLAKGIAKTDSKQYLEEAQTEIDERSAHEEIMLYGLVLGYAKMSTEQRMQALDMFVPKIHNWAVCDSCCMGYKFMKKSRKCGFLISGSIGTAAGSLKSVFLSYPCWRITLTKPILSRCLRF